MTFYTIAQVMESRLCRIGGRLLTKDNTAFIVYQIGRRNCTTHHKRLADDYTTLFP